MNLISSFKVSICYSWYFYIFCGLKYTATNLESPDFKSIIEVGILGLVNIILTFVFFSCMHVLGMGFKEIYFFTPEMRNKQEELKRQCQCPP